MTHHPIDPAQLSAIQARVDKATAGPWIRKDDPAVNNQPRVAGPVKANGKRDVIAMFPFGFKAGVVELNAEFIAHARADIPDLLAALAHLQAENTDRDARTAAIRARLEQAHAEVHAALMWPAQFELALPRLLREWQDLFSDAAAALRPPVSTR